MNGIWDFKCAYFDSVVNSEIMESKKRFYSGSDDYPDLPYLPPEISESWVRSKKNKIDPFAQLKDMNILRVDPSDLSVDNKMLLEAAVPLIEKELSYLFTITGMCLADKEGTILFTKEAARSVNKKLNVKTGSVLREETIGTLSQTLCLKYLKPVQLFGAIHYHSIFENDLSSSVPIFDEDRELIGVLTLVKSMEDGKWDANLEVISTHLVGWAKSLGYAIENQLKLTKKNHSLTIANQILEATVSAIDEGIVTIDCTGRIQQINKEGAKIFGGLIEQIVGKHIRAFIDRQDLLKKVLEQGETVEDLEVSFGKNRFEQRYLLRITPIFGEKAAIEGAVVCISSITKINNIVTRRGGNQAIYVFDEIIGKSKALTNTINMAKRIATTPNNVLLIGESGTGKELFAQSIHNMSRVEGPFIAINCASMPRNLIESELFGYEGGTFTGAEKRGRIGKIELAQGGTLFLDEIGDMPLEIQPVLLRVLEEKKVMRLGGNRYISVDFRLIAATNKNLYQAVQDKYFREDLYYRLSTFKITIPPLRERIEDIEILAGYFIEETCKRSGLPIPELSKDAIKVMRDYCWNGNVRQLQNAIVYAVNMSAGGGVIDSSHLPDELISINKGMSSLNKNDTAVPISLQELEKIAIEKALIYTEYDTEEAARKLGLSRATLYRRIKEYKIFLKQ